MASTTDATILKRPAEEQEIATVPETKVQKVEAAEPSTAGESSPDVAMKKEETTKGASKGSKGFGKGGKKGASFVRGHDMNLPVDDAAIKKQVEYYLSLENLKGDAFFNPILKEHGWLESEHLLGCMKLRKMLESLKAETSEAQWEMVVKACKESESLELEGQKIRRKDQEVPELVARKNSFNTNSKGKAVTLKEAASTLDIAEEKFRGGVVLRVVTPEKVAWGDVKASLKRMVEAEKEETFQAADQKIFIMWCSHKKREKKGEVGVELPSAEKNGEEVSTIDSEDAVYVCLSNFDQDLKLFRERCQKPLKVTIVSQGEEAATPAEGESAKEAESVDISAWAVVDDEEPLRKVVNFYLTQDVRERRKRQAKLSLFQKKQRQLKLAEGLVFDNLPALKKRVTSIMSMRKDGEQIDKESNDYKLIMTLLDFHPKGESKKKDLKGIEVNKSGFGDNRCFFVIREDGTKEDFSCIKIYASIQDNEDLLISNPKASVSRKGKGKK